MTIVVLIGIAESKSNKSDDNCLLLCKKVLFKSFVRQSNHLKVKCRFFYVFHRFFVFLLFYLIYMVVSCFPLNNLLTTAEIHMTQNYVLISTSLISFFSIANVSNVASSCFIKYKSARTSLIAVILLMGGFTSSEQAIASTISNHSFKLQFTCVNNYLDYASSHGIGGGGGGGHGNHERVLWREHAKLFNDGLLSKNKIKNTI